MGELFPTKSTTAAETASMILNHVGRFGSPKVIHTDQGPAFHNELVTELVRLCGIEQSFATAYSSEENGIVERANQEVLRHLRTLLFDSRVHNKWLFEQLPLDSMRGRFGFGFLNYRPAGGLFCPLLSIFRKNGCQFAWKVKVNPSVSSTF
jgi:transposase InsO family protein